MGRIRINELARELEVKPGVILRVLVEVGITEKKTHSSSLENEYADRIRQRFKQSGSKVAAATAPQEESTATAETESMPSAIPAEPALAGSSRLAAEEQSSPVHVNRHTDVQVDVKTVEEQTPEPVQPVSPPVPAPMPEQIKESAPSVAAAPSQPEAPPAKRRAPQPLRPPLALGKGGGPVGPRIQSATPTIQPPPPKPPTVSPPAVAKPKTVSAPKTASSAAPPAAAPKPAAPAMQPPPVPPKPPAPAPKPGAAIPSKPLPKPQPGQILTGPRQPLPSGLDKSKRGAQPGQPARPATPPPSIPRPPARAQRPQAPKQHAAETRPGAGTIVGKPAARPVVPPRPDLVARLKQQQQPSQPRPGMPKKGPVPGQPIYRGPIRPGQPVTRGPGVPAGRRRGQHPTSNRVETAGPPPPPAPGRRHQTKPGGRGRPQVRDRDREGKQRQPMPRRREEVFAKNKEITISEGITVKELSEKMGVKASLVVKKLLERKIFATINQALDGKTADGLAKAFGAKTTKMSFEEESVQELELSEETKDLERRPPVVTVMGHVDHGKTSLLDAIRSTTVAAREAGGITQHIGAYHVEHDGNTIVFIDTPGHEAFTRMRARGAKVTDIVILVVAADDGVMPQTLEAIDHAKAAEVPIIVAINKMDRPDANPDRVKQQLADRDLLAEDWGGKVVTVPVSAHTKEGLDLLLEMIVLVTEMQDLRANPDRPAVGTVLEAELDKGRGPVATVLVRNGTLRSGDHFICGSVFGRVRAMFDDRGDQTKIVGPSMPVEVIGLDALPEVGDTYQVVTDTVKAKQIVLYRESKSREQAMAKGARLTLDKLHEQLREGETKELNIILKADVGGSAEVVTDTLHKLTNEQVKVRVISSGVGAITERDVLLATASDAIIIGFNVRPERSATSLAEQEKIDIRLHTIIYELSDEVKKAMTGLLEPVYKEVFVGRAEVRDTFRITKVGTIAGCQVQDGSITRDSKVRLLRDNVVVHTGTISSLKRFKDDASEVKTGFECGIGIENFNDVKLGDVIEAFKKERVAVEEVA